MDNKREVVLFSGEEVADSVLNIEHRTGNIEFRRIKLRNSIFPVRYSAVPKMLEQAN